MTKQTLCRLIWNELTKKSCGLYDREKSDKLSNERANRRATTMIGCTLMRDTKLDMPDLLNAMEQFRN